tara:strand:- start:801 stop:1343 length:543 start_codon:yes stop_codon:yes gene_type:complete
MKSPPHVKIIIVGDMMAGKTSLMNKVCRDAVPEFISSTIGFEFNSVVYKEVKYNFWDTAGCDRFRSLIPQYYRGIDAVWVVVDGNDDEAEEHAKYWVRESRRYTDAPLLLVVNKKDLGIKKQWLDIAAQLDVPYIYGSALKETKDQWFHKLSMFLPKRTKKPEPPSLCVTREANLETTCC